MAPDLGNGKICYIELPSRDLEESKQFYEGVFGWIVRTRSDGSTAFDDSVNQVSGSWRTDRKPVTELGTLVHIMVFDMEKTIQLINNRGGKIVRPVGLDPDEVTAWFSDPTGNVLGLYQEKFNA